MKNGRFIVFEGIDGSGKTTQAKLLAERLCKKGNVQIQSEPTDSPTGQLIRQYLSGEKKVDPRVIAALFAADRLDHITNEENGIIALNKKGTTVICDRYYLSSFAYQGYALPLDWIIQINSEAVKQKKPDCHIFIEVDPLTAFERIKASRDKFEIFESVEKLIKINEKYHEVIKLFANGENIIIINADKKNEAQIADEIWTKI